jgi:hypothetical protein
MLRIGLFRADKRPVSGALRANRPHGRKIWKLPSVRTVGRRPYRLGVYGQDRRWNRLACSGLTILTLCGCAHAQARKPEIHLAPARFELHSNEPYQAVHIPFQLQDEDILVKANLAGKTVECDIDTGFDIIAWAERLHIAGRKLPADIAGVDGAGQKLPFTPVLLPTLQIGDYKLWKVLGASAKAGKQDAKPTSFTFRPGQIGNLAFQQVVFTVDYQKHELILRQPAYDFSSQPRGKQDMVFEMPSADDDNPVTLPVIQGVIEGRPARILLDTGWAGPEIGLTEAFHSAIRPTLAKEYPEDRSEKISRNMIGGAAQVERIPDVSFSLGDKPTWNVLCPALVISRTYTNVDAVIGPQVLGDFRVTIDYPRRKALLEPYPSDAARELNAVNARIMVNDNTYILPHGAVMTVQRDGKVMFSTPAQKASAETKQTPAQP